MLPFTHEDFLAVFAAYNQAIWPAQIFAYVLGLVMCAAIAWATPTGGKLVGIGLGIMWVWTGVAYHVLHFARINPVAHLFGALFIAQGLLFIAAAFRQRLRFAAGAGGRAWLGWGLLAYAMVFYPLIGLAAGGRYPALPMFGITPCPVTLFTFGALVLASVRVPWWMLAVPLAWSLLGGTAAMVLAIPQDWGLLLSGIAVVPIAWRNRELVDANPVAS